MRKMNMCAFHFTALAFLLVISQSIRFTECDQTFKGIAEVIIEASNSSIPVIGLPVVRDDFIRYVRHSLENTLTGNIEEVTLLQDQWTEDTVLSISFRGSFFNILPVPSCLQLDFRYEYNTLNFAYWFKSITMQNFEYDFEAECVDNGKNVAYFRYSERDCGFDMLGCESSHDLQKSYRYELSNNVGESVLYNFFCVDIVPGEEDADLCPSIHDWLLLDWSVYPDLNCSLPVYSYAPIQFLEAIGDSDVSGLARIGTFPFSIWCDPLYVAPPVITTLGDPTWNKLPGWLKTSIRVINGLSLIALLFCFVTFAMFKELLNAHGKNVLSLAIAKMLSLFYTSGLIPLVTTNRHLCVFLASLIYYAVLVPNYWWTAVAIFLAWTLGRKGIHRTDEVSGARFFLILSLFGWGVPLLFSLLVVFLHIGGIEVFNIEDYCWINQGWPNILITTQTFVPFIADCVLFILVVHRLRQTQSEIGKMDSATKMKRRSEVQLTIKLAAIFGVFWLPSWVVYAAFLFEPITSLAITVQLLNQLSIFVLPIVLCCNRRVALLWKAKMAPLRDRFSSITYSTSISDSRGSQPIVSNRQKHIMDRNTSPVEGMKIQLHEVHS